MDLFDLGAAVRLPPSHCLTRRRLVAYPNENGTAKRRIERLKLKEGESSHLLMLQSAVNQHLQMLSVDTSIFSRRASA